MRISHSVQILTVLSCLSLGQEEENWPINAVCERGGARNQRENVRSVTRPSLDRTFKVHLKSGNVLNNINMMRICPSIRADVCFYRVVNVKGRRVIV